MGKIFFLFIILIFSFFFDKVAFLAVEKIRYQLFNPIIVWSTTVGMLFLVGALCVVLFRQQKIKTLFLLAGSSAVAIQLSFILKIFLQIPRPYQIGVIEPLAFSSGYSFPSMHTAFVFSTLPIVAKEYPKIKWLWLLFALFIAFSRLYLGVHTIIDISGGAFLGYSIGWLLAYLDAHYDLIKRFLKAVNDKFELRRQLAHAVIGINLIVLRKLDFLPTTWLAALVIFGGICSVLSRYYELPIINHLLNYFERRHKRYTFPGQGSFFLSLGALLAFMLYQENVALAGIAVMALGDSVTNIIGSYFGKIKNPLNAKKNIEGTIAAIVVATLAAWYFVPLKIAFIGSLIAMVIESIDIKMGKYELDDNVLIPIIFGEVAALLRQ